MGLWDKLFGNASAPKAPPVTAPKPAPASNSQYDAVLKINQRNPNLGSSSFYPFSTLLCKGGTISVGKEVNGIMQPYGAIGYIRGNDTKTRKVCWKGGTEIGHIYPVNSDGSKGHIYLSLQGKYANEREFYKRGLRGREPHLSVDKLTWFVAEYSCGLICDEIDGEILGEYTGSPIDAAAAFICYVYDMGGDNKYYRYYQTLM